MKAVFVVLAIVGASLAMPKTSKWEIPQRRMETKDPLVHFSGANTRILNGWEVEPHSIPIQLRLVGTGPHSSWSCGASLISQKYALTAAHCVEGAVSLELLLGAHDLREAEPTQVTVTTTEYVRHEDYDESLITNDIAVIEFPSAVELTSAIAAATLASDQTNDSEGANVQVSGWGKTKGSGVSSSVLLAVNSTILDFDSCNAVFGDFRDDQVCIDGSQGIGHCNGDSGGPLVSQNEQIGIVSYGVGRCRKGYPSFFTRVSSFLPWIKSKSDL